MGRTVAIILAGGEGKRLSILTRYRAKPAVPFAGRYRIIDFTMTNCVRSGINEVYIMTQYIYHSLIRHLGSGKPWDLDHTNGGLHILHPHLGFKPTDWYRGTADAVFQNYEFLEGIYCDNFLILSGDHVYIMDYSDFILSHEMSGVDASVGVVNVPKEMTSQFGIVTDDPNGRIIAFHEKPKHVNSTLASMGIYLFKKEILLSLLKKLKARYENLDFGSHVIPYLVENGKISAYRFNDFWLDIGTVKGYYEASMGLLKKNPKLRLFGTMETILTVPDDSPPLFISKDASVENSIISDGCRIFGTVSSSVLSPRVEVEKGAIVENSIVFHDSIIREGAVVKNAILDKEVIVGKGVRIYGGRTEVPNKTQPDYLNFGLSLIGKRTRIPSGLKIGSNCIVSGSPYSGYIPRADITDGETIIVE